ncbi:hypothetical protein NVP1033O_69 [Vibrio phage 1.033.O._10N.222.49.B8]|nr:hypothetical protein NVP1033O_69 [Vibrio phage 1.033.O._10N.222.49.B8]
MCNCFDEMLERVKGMATEQLKDTPMVEGSLKIDWKNRVFFLDRGKSAPVALYLETEYIPLKKDGTPAKNKKKLENGFKMSHCPFCGEKYSAEA